MTDRQILSIQLFLARMSNRLSFDSRPLWVFILWSIAAIAAHVFFFDIALKLDLLNVVGGLALFVVALGSFLLGAMIFRWWVLE